MQKGAEAAKPYQVMSSSGKENGLAERSSAPHSWKRQRTVPIPAYFISRKESLANRLGKLVMQSYVFKSLTPLISEVSLQYRYPAQGTLQPESVDFKPRVRWTSQTSQDSRN